MRILISNDDGIYGSGMIPLIKALRTLGDLVVIVPEAERSAASHSITLHKPFRERRVPVLLSDKEKFMVHITNGTPADCVRFGVLKLLKDKKIDLCVGGINQGPNLGEDTVYSGTVAVAREAAMLGIPSFAMSMVHGAEEDFEKAAQVALRVAKLVLKKRLPPRVFLNVNVPALIDRNDFDLEVTRLGRRVYGKEITSRVDPRGEEYYWLAGEVPEGIPDDNTDIAALLCNKVSVTPLSVDSTAASFLGRLKSWKFKKY